MRHGPENRELDKVLGRAGLDGRGVLDGEGRVSQELVLQPLGHEKTQAHTSGTHNPAVSMKGQVKVTLGTL